MSAAVNNEITMNSVKNIESDLNENLNNDILEMDNGSLNIEQAFLVEQQQQEQQKHNQQSGTRSSSKPTAQQSVPKARKDDNTANQRSKSPSLTFTTTTRFSNTGIQDMQSYNNQTKAFRFVNNSINSMYKQKSRMKPAFKVGSQTIQGNGDHLGNSESVIIEQNFNNNDDGSQVENSNDRKYVFQLNVKRPPGRPRKYPVEKTKAKRPQGRPRKYPIEVTGSTINHHNHSTNPSSKVVKKALKDTNGSRAISVPVPMGTEPTSLKKDGKEKQPDLDPAFAQNDTNFVIATAGAAQSTFTHGTGKP